MVFSFPSRVRRVKNLPICCSLCKSLLFFSQPKHKGSQIPWAHSALICLLRYWKDFVLPYTHRNQPGDSAYPEVNKSSRTPSLADSLFRPSVPFLPDPSSWRSGMNASWHLNNNIVLTDFQHTALYKKNRSSTCSDYLMHPWPVLSYAVFTGGLNSFFKVYKEKNKGFKNVCLVEHYSQTPLLTGDNFCSRVKVY